MTRLVIIESPYAGNVTRNIDYARECLADSLKRGEAPIVSHLLYTQPGVLDDDDPEQRRLGIEAGYAWMKVADAVIFYVDLDISNGMQAGWEAARKAGVKIETRIIHKPLDEPRQAYKLGDNDHR